MGNAQLVYRPVNARLGFLIPPWTDELLSVPNKAQIDVRIKDTDKFDYEEVDEIDLSGNRWERQSDGVHIPLYVPHCCKVIGEVMFEYEIVPPPVQRVVVHGSYVGQFVSQYVTNNFRVWRWYIIRYLNDLLEVLATRICTVGRGPALGQVLFDYCPVERENVGHVLEVRGQADQAEKKLHDIGFKAIDIVDKDNDAVSLFPELGQVFVQALLLLGYALFPPHDLACPTDK